MSLILKVTKDGVTSYMKAKSVAGVRANLSGSSIHLRTSNITLVARLDDDRGYLLDLDTADSFSVLPEDYEEVQIHAANSAPVK